VIWPVKNQNNTKSTADSAEAIYFEAAKTLFGNCFSPETPRSDGLKVNSYFENKLADGPYYGLCYLEVFGVNDETPLSATAVVASSISATGWQHWRRAIQIEAFFFGGRTLCSGSGLTTGSFTMGAHISSAFWQNS
jgi:hypothetical protein